MERLSHIICDAVRKRSWSVVKIGRGGPEVSHLMFADDLILFGEATMGQVEVMKECLDRFCSMSGQKVSASKSSIYFSPNTSENLRKVISDELKILRKKTWGFIWGFLFFRTDLESEAIITS